MKLKNQIKEAISSSNGALLGLMMLFGAMLFAFLGGILGKFIFGSNIEISNFTIACQNHHLVNYLKYMQLVSAFAIFIIPAAILAFFKPNFLSLWNFKVKKSYNTTLIIALIMIVGLPFVNWTAALNAQLHLPNFLKVMQNSMASMEKSNQMLEEAFMNSLTIKGLLLNIFMMAILPAIGEELLFRGIIQPLFHKYTKRIHLSIFLTAFLFSAIHMQFLSFLPRFLMGIFFGYLFYYGKSLWLPMIGHFVNNGIAVIAYFLMTIGKIKSSPDTIANTSASWQMGLISACMISGLIYYLFYELSKQHGKIS